MSEINIISVGTAGKISHMKRFHTSKDFNILSKMAAVLGISFFLENETL